MLPALALCSWLGCAPVPPLDSTFPAEPSAELVEKTSEELALAAARALRSRRYEMAIDLYGELVRRDPMDPGQRQALGYALIRLERWDQAETQFEAALRWDPGSRESMLGLGVARFQRGDVPGAQQILQTGLDTFPPGSEREGWKTLVERQLPGIALE